MLFLAIPKLAGIRAEAAASVSSAFTCSSAYFGGVGFRLRTGCGATQFRLFRKSLLQPPLRDLNTRGEPNALMSLHVFDHFSQHGGPSRSTGNVRMELKRGESRRYRRFMVELVEKALPQRQSIVRMVAGSVLVAVKSAVAKRLARKFDQPRLPALPDERKIVGERITVPDITLFHKDLHRVDALRTCAPAHRTLARPLHEHVRSPPGHVFFFLSGQVPGDLVVVSVAGDLVPLFNDGFDCVGIPFSDAAAGQERCLDFNFVQHSENPPDAGFRAVFAFGVVFVVHFAVGEWPNRLSALKIESYRHRHATVLGPEYFSLRVIFSDHHAVSLFRLSVHHITLI